MFFCYVDESGYNGKKYNSKQPVQVMAGIFPNVYKFHRSDSEFKAVRDIINLTIPVSEIKGEQIYRGRGSWAKVPPDVRDQVIELYLNWVTSRNHKLILNAIDNKLYFDLKKQDNKSVFFSILPCPYLLGGLHIALLVQKLNRKMPKNKGKTILIFDEQGSYSHQLADLIFDPPEWIDDFVEFDPKSEVTRLCQIIDTAFFVRSHHSSMAQVVDIVAYLFRLHLELENYGLPESYAGESDKISGWIHRIENKFVPFDKVYPKTNKPFLNFVRSVKAKGI